MKLITEYLTTKISKSTIKAFDSTIKKIVIEEMDKYGHDCDLNHIDVSEVTQMGDLFYYAIWTDKQKYADLNPDISKWDVSNAISMSSMFQLCKKFNCDIGDWTPDNVLVTNSMFYDCESFNQDLSRWHLCNAKITNNMFTNCPIEEKFKPKMY